jgi:hypothetical protein
MAKSNQTDKDVAAPVDTVEKKSKNADKAKGLFKDHPGVKALHFTSDGLAFFEKNDARNHAFGLKEKEIETIQK